MSNFLVNLSDVRDIKRNYIINGAMDYWQRETSFSGGANTQYGPDRFRVEGGGSFATFVASRSTDVPSSLFNFSLNLSKSLAGGSTLYASQRIEADMTKSLVGGKATFTAFVKGVSGQSVFFTIKKPISGTKDGWPATRTASETTVATSSGFLLDGSWQKFSFTFDVDSTLVNGFAVQVSINSTTLGDFFTTTGWQLEEGNVATDFVRAGGDIVNELQLCQRYYEKSYAIDVVPGTNGAASGLSGFAYSATIIAVYMRFITQKRTTPVFNVYSVLGLVGYVTNINNSTEFGPSFNLTTVNSGGAAVISGGTGLTIGSNYRFHFTADAEL